MDDKIERRINNPTFEHIDEPVALFFSYTDPKTYKKYDRDVSELSQKQLDGLQNFKVPDKEGMAAYLRKNKYPAVTDKDDLCTDPAAIVVTNTGIQTPFLPPEAAKAIAYKLAETIMQSERFTLFSNIYAVRFEQLPDLIEGDEDEDDNPLIKALEKIPNFNPRDEKQFQQYRQCVAEELLAQLPCEKFRTPWDKEAWIKEKRGEDQVFAGRKIGYKPYDLYPFRNMEGRSTVYAAPNYTEAETYSLNPNTTTRDGQTYGFLFRYQVKFYQSFYENFGMERGRFALERHQTRYETSVVPKENPVLGIDLILKEDKKSKHAYDTTSIYHIDPNADLSEFFLKLHSASFRSDNLKLRARLRQIKLEAKINNTTQAYNINFYNFDDFLLINAARKKQKTEELNDGIKNAHQKVYENKKEAGKTSPFEKYFLFQPERISHFSLSQTNASNQDTALSADTFSPLCEKNFR